MNKIIGIIALMITVIAGMLCLGPPGQTIDDQATIALLITISDATDIVADYAVIMTATPATRSTTQNDFAISAELINCGAGEFALINRFAVVLTELGVTKGDRIFVLAPNIPQLMIAALGVWGTASRWPAATAPLP